MSLENMTFKDFSGGLNLRDPRSALALNQVSEASNLLFDEKGLLATRKGQKLLQYAPIDPKAYTVDANTLLHYTFDGATPGATEANNGSLAGYTLDLAGDPTLNGAPSAPALFPIGAGLGRQSVVADNSGNNDGTAMYAYLGALPFDNLSALTMRGWAKLSPAFTGAPVNVTRAGDPSIVPFSNSGAILFGTAQNGVIQFVYGGGINNGFTLHRDYDTASGKDTSDPYVKFTLRTKGVPGTVTVLQSRPLPTSVMLEFEGSYDSATGKVSLYVNGDLHATATAQGGGLVDDSLAYNLMALGSEAQGNGAYANIVMKTCMGTVLDEWEIANVVRTSFPFKKPRSRGMNLVKADGTVQMVVAAADWLFYTIGDGNYYPITGVDPKDGQSLSLTADWDGVQIGDRLYMTNGVNTPLTWDGTRLVPTGEAVLPLSLTLAGTGSTHTNGVFKYVYTFKYGDLDETGFSPSASITVGGNSDVNIDLILSRMSNCTAIRIYRTKAGGSQYFFLREIANDSTVNQLAPMSGLWGNNGSPSTDTGADGVPDGSTATNLNDDADYPLADPVVAATKIPKGRYYLTVVNRLMMAGMTDRPYDVSISKLGNPDVFPAALFVAVPTDKGLIVAIYQYYGEVHISLNGRGTNVLGGTDESNWSLTTVLHPDAGARDHWSIAQRYPVGDAGRYILVFAGLDGEYMYAGQNITKISDLLNPLFDSFSLRNALLESWVTTEQTDFQAAKNLGGATSLNIQADAYETDGLRQNPGSIEVTDQFEYIGLYKLGAPTWVGSIIAQVRGLAENEFFFSTDGDNNLYHTFDNFQTATVYTAVGGATERIIEIVQRGANDFYFLFTDTAGTGLSSGGGYVYTWDNVASALNPLYNTAPIFYNFDVPFRLAAGIVGTTVYSMGPQGFPYATAASAPFNLFINHPQKIFTMGGGAPYNQPILSATAINTIAATATGALARAGSNSDLLGAGFYSYAFPVNAFSTTYTRREFPLWRGGTFRPQAFWDAGNSRLVFVATTADDADGNSSCSLRTLSAAGVLTIQYNAEAISSFAIVGTKIYMWGMSQFVGGFTTGTVGRLLTSTLANPSAVAVAGTYQPNLAVLRLSANVQNSAILLASAKVFNTATQEFWSYTGNLYREPIATGLPSILLSLPANGDSGPCIPELAVQTTTPYAWYGAVSKATTEALYSIDVLAASVSPYEAPYESPITGGVVTGILSNLLFVAASGSPTYNWADRLYFMASAAVAPDGRLVQIGVPGTWRVVGSLASKANNLGVFTAFGSLETDFSGQVGYFLRSAASQGALAASELVVTPNAQINGFPIPGAWAQWRVSLTWDYSVALPLGTPSVKDVLIQYFLGAANSPRPVGIHWRGRTYFAFASVGATANDTVVVFDKGNAFTVYNGWQITAFMIFRGMLCAFQQYDLVQLEEGTTDLGAPIQCLVRTGTIAGENTVSLQDIKANVEGSNSHYFPNANGYAEIVPMAGDDELAGIWMVPLPPSKNLETRRIQGQPDENGFQWSYGQSYSLRIRTSQKAAGSQIEALPDQQLNISQIDVALVAFAQGRNYAGK